MNTATNHILVPVDYSDKSAYGLQMAANLLEKCGGAITVLNVLKGVDPIFSDVFTDEERQIWLGKLKSHLWNFAEKYIDFSRFKCNVVIEKGRLCETILKTADNIAATTIVMGTSTADNIKKRIIGTNALRVVSEAKIPVITLKNEPKTTTIKRIVLPLDITKDSREKTVEAVKIAKCFDADIMVVSAYSINDDSIINKLQLQMNQILDYIKSHNVDVTGQILRVNNRVDEILNFIDVNKADLIVITTHQQLEVVNSFIGSFAKSIIHAAKIPVVSIVPKVNHYQVFAMPGVGNY